MNSSNDVDLGCYMSACESPHITLALTLFSRVGGVVVSSLASYTVRGRGWIPRSTHPREVRLGHLPMQPPSVDSAKRLGNSD